MNHLFDSLFNDMSGIDMYRSWVIPGLYPDQPKPCLQNWSVEDLEMYCGIDV